jgi:hypothetical protein
VNYQEEQAVEKLRMSLDLSAGILIALALLIILGFTQTKRDMQLIKKEKEEKEKQAKEQQNEEKEFQKRLISIIANDISDSERNKCATIVRLCKNQDKDDVQKILGAGERGDVTPEVARQILEQNGAERLRP